MTAFDLIADWDVPHVAAAVVSSPDGTSLWGDIGRSFRIASVAKLLAAYAALVAIEERTITLDDPAGPTGSTVRHLLSHASGYPFDGADPIAPPGRTRIYSNTGIERFADYLSEAAGIPFGEYLHEGVLEPLGMAETELRGSPAYGVWSTASDLSRFAAELLSPTLVAPESLALATAVQFPGLSGVLPGLGRMDPCDWGLGFELKSSKHPHWMGTKNDPGAFGHFGGAGTFLWVDPPTATACLALTDREFGPWALEHWPVFSDAVLAEALGNEGVDSELADSEVPP
jgi:CubicO group peptidase (beta-lactamase class C family)